MTTLDLGPAATRMADLVRNMPDDALGRPTPCVDTSVGDLLDHIAGLSLAFTSAARKDGAPESQRPPSADAAQLGDDWRSRIPAAVTALAAAWRDSDAWTGTTRAGGREMPGEIAGVVALDELVIHGWDIARASGQPYDCDEQSLQATHEFVLQFAAPEAAEQREGLFGPVVPVADHSALFDRVLGLTGRDPNWSAP